MTASAEPMESVLSRMEDRSRRTEDAVSRFEAMVEQAERLAALPSAEE